MAIKNKIIFFGTSGFGIPVLEALYEAGFDIAAIVTSPDTPAGRGYEMKKSPLKDWAEKTKIKVLQPENLKDKKFTEELAAFGADIFVMAAYGKIIPAEILKIAPLGTVNVHPSLLPKYRGASPIQNVILNGETETGITLILTDEKMDHGMIIAQEKIYIESSDNNKTLHERLSMLAAGIIVEVINGMAKNKIMPKAQDETEATYTKMIKRDDGKINWSRTADEIERMTRAYFPWPGAFTFLPDGKRLKVFESEIIHTEYIQKEFGTLFETENKEPAVRCGKNSLILKRVQTEGNAATDGKSFLNGHRKLLGEQLN